MADMFDLNLPGVGWLGLVAAMALAALVVACLAITGHISGTRHHPSAEQMRGHLDDTYYQDDDEIRVSKITNSGVTNGEKLPIVALTATATTKNITLAESGTTFYITLSGSTQYNLVLPPATLGATYNFVLAGSGTSIVTVYPNGYTATGGLPATVVASTIEVLSQDNGTAAIIASAVGDATALGTGGVEFGTNSLAGDFMTLTCVSTGTAAAGTPQWAGSASGTTEPIIQS